MPISPIDPADQLKNERYVPSSHPAVAPVGPLQAPEGYLGPPTHFGSPDTLPGAKPIAGITPGQGYLGPPVYETPHPTGLSGKPIAPVTQPGQGFVGPPAYEAPPPSPTGTPTPFGSPDVLPGAKPITGLTPDEQTIWETRTGVKLPPLSYLMANYFSIDPVLRQYYEKGMQDVYAIPAESIRFAAQKFRPVGLSGRPRIGWAAEWGRDCV